MFVSGELRIVYNHDPPSMSDEEFLATKGRTLPLSGKYAEFNKLPEGATSTDNFIEYVGTMSAVARLLQGQIRSMSDSTVAATTYKNIEKLMKKEWTDEQKAIFKTSFDFYDDDNSGKLSKAEIVGAFRKLNCQEMTSDDVDELLQNMGKESPIDFEGFLQLLAVFSTNKKASKSKAMSQNLASMV